MQDYLQRTRLAGRMDEAGSTLALLTGSVVFFLLLWGVRITAVLAGIAAFALLMLLRARTRDRRLQNREDRLRRQGVSAIVSGDDELLAVGVVVTLILLWRRPGSGSTAGKVYHTFVAVCAVALLALIAAEGLLLPSL